MCPLKQRRGRGSWLVLGFDIYCALTWNNAFEISLSFLIYKSGRAHGKSWLNKCIPIKWNTRSTGGREQYRHGSKFLTSKGLIIMHISDVCIQDAAEFCSPCRPTHAPLPTSPSRSTMSQKWATLNNWTRSYQIPSFPIFYFLLCYNDFYHHRGQKKYKYMLRVRNYKTDFLSIQVEGYSLISIFDGFTFFFHADWKQSGQACETFWHDGDILKLDFRDDYIMI